MTIDEWTYRSAEAAPPGKSRLENLIPRGRRRKQADDFLDISLRPSDSLPRRLHAGLWLRLTLLPFVICHSSFATESLPGAPGTNEAYQIDLPTALRLAGAQNLDVQIARERLAEAKANHQSAVAQFFPWVSPGITYRQHDDKLQDVSGNLIDVHKYSYAPGATVGVQLDLGDALYQSLAAKQLASAAGHGLEARRQDSVLAAARGYFELALAQGAVGVGRESVRIAGDYEAQLSHAVGSGIAFKGDLLRARVQAERNRLTLRQAQEQQRVAAARLAQLLHLNPAVELLAQDSELVALRLIATNAALDPLVQQALASRPELKQGQSLAAAARDAKNGASYGPLIPSLGAQGFWGGLGGGRTGVGDTFGGQQDFLVGANWRIGPGGLFDFGRVRSAEARLKIATLNSDQLRDDVTRQVVEAFTHWQSLADQLATAQRALAAAEEGLRLAQQRKEFAVGVVLETIQAEQDLTRARLEYLKTVADFNQAQFALNQATGRL
jgi:outer membrane protein TolC